MSTPLCAHFTAISSPLDPFILNLIGSLCVYQSIHVFKLFGILCANIMQKSSTASGVLWVEQAMRLPFCLFILIMPDID